MAVVQHHQTETPGEEKVVGIQAKRHHGLRVDGIPALCPESKI